MLRITARIVAAGVAMVLASSAVAQDRPSSAPATSAQPVAFPKGTDTLQFYGNYMGDPTNPDVRWGGLNAGIGHYVFDDVSLNIEAAVLAIDQPGPETWAGSLGILLRQHVVNVDRLSLFIDVGGGAFEANHNVPEGGTPFNILFRTGIGITYRLAENVYFLGGTHFVHLSNARIEGADRNPAINGIEGYAGLMFTF